MDKREDKSKMRKGEFFMYGTSILEDNNKLQYPNFKEDRIKLFLNNLILQVSKYLKRQIEVSQTNLIEDIEYLNKSYGDVLNYIAEGLDNTIKEIESIEYENIYLKDLSDLENIVDKSHLSLLRIKDIILSPAFNTVHSSKKNNLLKITNKNIDYIFKIRDKIEQLDIISEETRYYIELSNKYNSYKKLAIFPAIISVLLCILSLLPLAFVLCYTFITFLMILGINKDKTNYFKRFFPNINPKVNFANKESL